MIKRLFFVAALLLSVQLVSAQTMTDDQVVKMIMDQKKAGADETTIARNLLQKGATPAQIRRIKEKYEQEQKGLGAVDLTGEGGKVNRLRDEKNKKNSKIVKTNKNNRNNVRNYNSSEDNYMILFSMAEIYDNLKVPELDKMLLSNYIAVVYNSKTEKFSYYLLEKSLDGYYAFCSIDENMEHTTHSFIENSKKSFVENVLLISGK